MNIEIKVDGLEMEEIKEVIIDEAKSNSINDALVFKKGGIVQREF